MNVLITRNVHQALPVALAVLRAQGEERDSRNGPVLQSPMPVTTQYDCPRERVLFWSDRDANPFFHFMESMWMLGGRDDLAFVEKFVKRMRQFSDDGLTLHGAYGKRWRDHFLSEPLENCLKQGGVWTTDQLKVISQALRDNPQCRRQVLGMWDPDCDLGREGKDVPCNLTATFQVNARGSLDMSVFCRSNDIIWGCYGANAVHFSYLLEYVALRAGFPVGTYWQISVNWHAYQDIMDRMKSLERAGEWCPYTDGEVEPFPLAVQGTDMDMWDEELEMFLDEGLNASGYQLPFFRRVALPLMQAHELYKECEAPAKFDAARLALDDCLATDWKKAALEWLDRRELKWKGSSHGA